MKVTNPIKATILGSLMASASVAFYVSSAKEESVVVEQVAPRVSVAEVISQRITEWDEFTGRIQAPETVSLRPRVSGYIQSVNFGEGSIVNEGDVLFEIDPRPFKARVTQLSAQLSTAQSQLTLAESEFIRAEELLERNAIAVELRDARRSAFEQSKAQVNSVAAQLELAQLDLSYTQVEAPISGRVSNALITRGNFVNAGESVLTSLVSVEEVYVYFDADEQTYLKYMELEKAGERESSRNTPNLVYMGLASQDDYSITGYIDFVDNQVNGTTGTIRGRAVFQNSDGLLLPGMFARVKLVGSGSYDGILVDDRSIGTDLNNRYVLALAEDNSIEYRRVELGEKLSGLRIIKQGLTAEDRIVVNGVQHVWPGMTIDPVEQSMADEEVIAEITNDQLKIDAQQSNTEFLIAQK